MHFFKALAVPLVFATGILAGPVAVPEEGASATLVARKSVNDCQKSSFHDHTGNKSPLISDCRTVIKNISGGGTWLVAHQAHQLISYGSCKMTWYNTGALTIKIGNQDVIDLINSSIDKFGKNGRVGANGKVDCQVVGSGTNTATWDIHS